MCGNFLIRDIAPCRFSNITLRGLREASSKRRMFLLFGAWQAAECQNHIEDSLGSTFSIHAIPGNKNVENPNISHLPLFSRKVMPRDINKSAAVNRIMLNNQPDFILGFGDDRADEEMFAFVNKIQGVPDIITCTVGLKSTEAQWFVNSVAGVITALETLVGL
ncbi:hypothetical protein BC936DRAFT_141373 [Jimgerdemannia flammicorona]|uniref:Trehalose 6-phosphate phosphatase n=1 Tax=Jimgerdemannia flammicorona TaxID=994334 RepID=A0A433A2C5_9FUNG|nr:hypothetical protein BC936DRAFT_141373 [Jimgerdemannia flammicorona]